jgi:hypothetical protein
MKLEVSEMSQEGALLTWKTQLLNNQQTEILEIKDGKQISMIQCVQLICHKFRDLPDQTPLLSQINLIHRDVNVHCNPKKITLLPEMKTAFPVIHDLLRIYLQWFLLALKTHLRPNQDLQQCRLQE